MTFVPADRAGAAGMFQRLPIKVRPRCPEARHRRDRYADGCRVSRPGHSADDEPAREKPLRLTARQRDFDAPFYKPTPSVKNRNNFFPQTEELGADELLVTFMGSNPWPPRFNQAGTSIMAECGEVGRFFFGFGSACLRNIIGMQMPIPEINAIFINRRHVDHFADLPYLSAFSRVPCAGGRYGSSVRTAARLSSVQRRWSNRCSRCATGTPTRS
jgi:hypothetical protein